MTNSKILKPIIFVILIATVTLGVFFLIPQKNTGGTGADVKNDNSGAMHKIVLTEDGFSPDTITIKKGESIEFSNITKKFFWPASNIHPTHSVYPEFDPKTPIEPDKKWSFTFDKAGSWRFHDHLSPYYTGTITVEE